VALRQMIYDLLCALTGGLTELSGLLEVRPDLVGARLDQASPLARPLALDWPNGQTFASFALPCLRLGPQGAAARRAASRSLGSRG